MEHIYSIYIYIKDIYICISSVQLLTHVKLLDYRTPGFPVHHQLLKFTQTHFYWIGDAIQLSHPLSSPLLLPSIFKSIRVFSNESVLHIRCQSIGVSASASVLPMNIQDWFPLGWTGLISLLSKGLSRVFSNTTVERHQFFANSYLYSPLQTFSSPVSTAENCWVF